MTLNTIIGTGEPLYNAN